MAILTRRIVTLCCSVKRDIEALSQKEYDLIVVGGGIFGICAAWDATLRGLSVALVENHDFAHATSANCFKMVHGGIRYLQHGDIYRVREGSRERTTFLRIAPHLVDPLPIVIPTYGHGLQGKAIIEAGKLLYDLITFDRNRGVTDPDKRIPHGEVLSRGECLELFPGLDQSGLTGGAVIYDGQMYSPPRLALSFLKSAVRAGADTVNYVEATGFLREGNRVTGVEALDLTTGNPLEIRGRVVLNAAGPWAESLLERAARMRVDPPLAFSRDASLVVNRRLTDGYALALKTRTRDPDAVLSRGARHLFLVPWRDCTLVGVWHVVHNGHPESFSVTEEEIRAFLDEVNKAYTFAEPLSLKDVSLWNAGLTLFGNNKPGSTDLSFGKRSRIIDHAKEHGIDRLISLVGVRYTTARGVAESAIDLVLRNLGRRATKSTTSSTPVYGGDIESFGEFCRSAIGRRPAGVGADALQGVLRNHGSEYMSVLRLTDEDPEWAETLAQSNVMKAEVVHAVRSEMALKLEDVVFRRTDLGTAGHPGVEALSQCADLMAAELGWSRSRVDSEMAQVEAVFPTHTKETERITS